MGVVPQNDRRPRPIVDYSFSGVNAETVTLAPQEAMQFGRTLERLIRQVVRSDPRFGPVHFLKIDIADGFYRVWLDVHDIPTLAVSIPSLPGEPALLALPLALPMGWTQSPPAFCTVTETIADLANRRLHRHGPYPRAHRLESLANTPSTDQVAAPPDPARSTASTLPPPNPLLSYFSRPLAAVDVFMDDFIGVAQGSPAQLTKTRRHLLHTIDSVFRPLSATDSPFRTEPISVTKLLKGDAAWAPCKKILGWIIDSHSMTITLPPRRLQRLADLLESIQPTRKRLSTTAWHQLLGELRSMSLAIPGARGLFSHLQHAFTHRKGSRLRLTPAFHQAIDDFRWLQQHLAHRPTRLYELVPTAPTLIGTHDAAGSGAGGVWIPQPSAVLRQHKLWRLSPNDSTDLQPVYPREPVPIVWRVAFPSTITARLVSSSNPHGTINNSELELVGALLHDDVAAQCFDVRERTLRSATDNVATLHWYRRGSVTTTSPTATLLRHKAMHQRFHRYLSLKDYVPGPLNSLADDASRLHHLSDAELLSHFNRSYPQALPWHLFPLPSAMLSTVTSALRKRKLPLASFLQEPPPLQPIGPFGNSSAPTMPSILPFKTSPIPSPTFKCLPTAIVKASSTPATALSGAAPWKVPYATLAKRSRLWGPQTPGSRSPAPSTSASSACWQATPALTPPQHGSNPFLSPSSGTSWPKRSLQTPATP